MHHISNLKVKNYKSIKDAEFQLSPYTPIVGYNNAGKTNILNALLCATKNASLGIDHYYDQTLAIEIIVVISGITQDVINALDENHRGKITPLVRGGKILLRRTYPAINSAEKKSKLEIQKHNENGGVEWGPLPTGIDNSISRLFPEPIFIGAMEDAGEDISKSRPGTTIGKILKEITAHIRDAYTEEVNTALTNIKGKLEAESPNKDVRLKAIDEEIQRQLDMLFPDMRVEINIPTPSFDDFINSGTIQLADKLGDNKMRHASNFGHGAQRMAQIALIKCLADKTRGATGQTSGLLLIDEPELYLHPQAIDAVREALMTLSGGGYQVIFSSHSPVLIHGDSAPDTLIVRRDADNGSRAIPTIRSRISEVISNHTRQTELIFELGNAAEIFFSEKVLFVEGKTEIEVIPLIFEKIHGRTLAAEKIGVVPLNGVRHLKNTMDIAKSMGVNCKSIVDLDFAFRVAIRSGLIPPENNPIRACNEIFARLENAGLISLEGDLPTKHNGTPASKAFELLAQETDAQQHIDNLATQLATHGIWLWKKGAIELHLDFADKNEYRQFRQRLNEQDDYLQEMEDFQNLEALVQWIKS